MASKVSKNPHVDFGRFGSKSRSEINADAAREKAALGLTGEKRNRRVVHGPPVNVRLIREKLGLSQYEFAQKYHFSERTIQEWEQQRAVPRGPSRVLLFAIEESPDLIADIVRKIDEAERQVRVLAGVGD